MPITRLEAFSDAVIATTLTIMVLELRAPLGHERSSRGPVTLRFHPVGESASPDLAHPGPAD